MEPEIGHRPGLAPDPVIKVVPMNRIIQISLSGAVALLLAMGGCGSGGGAQSTAEVRKDAAEAATREAEARMDATYGKEQARKHASESQAAGAMADPAHTRSAALASAEASHASAVSRCEGEAVEAYAACKERAESEFATAKARAEAAPPPHSGGP
jgi:hypothetical protein